MVWGKKRSNMKRFIPNIYWFPPNMIIKMKSYFGKPRLASGESILCDHKGRVQGSFSIQVGTTDFNELELIAIIKSLYLSSYENNLVRRNILIEYDFANTIQ